MTTQTAGLTAEEQGRIRAAARAWRGTPYHPDARLRGVGVDCGNLLVAVFADAGLVESFSLPPAPRGWHLHSKDERYLLMLLRYCDRVEPPWQTGDVLLFRGKGWPSAGHGGLVVDDLLYHALEGRQVEAWPLDEMWLLRTLEAGFRLRRG